MNTKTYFLLALIPALAAPLTHTSASPLVSIGDHADLFFNGSSSLRWTSNLFRDEDDEEDDLVWTVSPGLELNIGRGQSNADFSVITRYDILMYEDNDDLDTELFHIKALGAYQTSRWDVDGELSFDERQTTTGDANVDADLIESDETQAKLNGEYRLSPKFSFGAGVHYFDKEYTSYEDQLADYERWSLPFNLYYELTPKVDLSVGYTYSMRDVSSYTQESGDVIGGYDTETHFLNVGARGELLPKLTGFFKVGYTVRDSDDSTNIIGGSPVAKERNDNDGTLGLDADLTWAQTPKLTHNLMLHRGFGVGGEGDATTVSKIDVASGYAINPFWSASSSLGYTLREYEDNNGREDDQIYLGLSGDYTPNRFWRFSLGYRYSENDSNEDNRSYEDHSITFVASLRY
ncbi:MAG: outer membrane beta-barrel protein [Coraliomargarita sp.]